MPDLDLTVVDRVVTRIADARMAAIEAMVGAHREQAWGHCRATKDPRADFPILSTDGQSALTGIETIRLCCGVCQEPVAGLRYGVTLTGVDVPGIPGRTNRDRAVSR